ncbi:hypothetical protein [Evansella halocellulosilytica]|uniref:hypothetical protein n=1 Tax=Evansella halocellulosilytica TaxID=2011013 RepID=UPI0015C738B9|nr:hypothetical protein [Evansella halocellulosilytica]
MDTQNIYILLTDTGTMFTRTIKLFTKEPYNHASISFDSDLDEVYSFGRKTARNPFIGGFVKEDIRGSIFKHANGAIYRCNVTKEQLVVMKDFIKHIEKQKECYRYNLLGLFAILIDKQITRNNAFFCSQFVATILQTSEVIHFNKPLSHVTPRDVIAGHEFERIYEGPLSQYIERTNAANTVKIRYMNRDTQLLSRTSCR